MPTKKPWDILSKVHVHPRDERIVFHEEGHRYEIDGSIDGWTSATSVLSSLHTPFDAEKAATCVINGKKYKSGDHPLNGKTKDEIIQHWNDENKRGTALHARMEFEMQMTMNERTIVPPVKKTTGTFRNHVGDGSKESRSSSSSSSSSSTSQIQNYVKHRIMICDKTGKVFIWYPPGTSMETKKLLHLGYQWTDGTIRRNRHEDAELGDGEPVLSWNEAIMEALQIHEFWNEHALKRGLIPYRSEWVIWDETHRIAGTIDALMYNTKTGGYWIYDWKRVARGLEVDVDVTRYGYCLDSEEWLGEVTPWTKRMCYPVEELYDTKYWHYALQLNLYRSILERHYGICIEGMVLVQLHPTLAGVRCHRVVRLEDPIIRILEKRRVETQINTKDEQV